MVSNPAYRHSIRFAFAPLLAALLCVACTSKAESVAGREKVAHCGATTPSSKSEAGLEQRSLCVDSGLKKHSFTVEMAITSQQQMQGMMFRTELADDKGMLFPFDDIRPASFWMKNTVIPLDIIFVRKDGTIANIAVNTVPYSTDPVPSDGPVAAVLELRGGLTLELGINAGDRVYWSD